ncbi:hypothetical protein EHM92_01390 [bacterium]|nr:MAG: hypothetical protein EHM92_01390 [bacterium]
MKTHLLYIIIGVLLAGNAALLLKKTPLPPPVPSQAEQHDLLDRVALLDSLALRRWADNSVVRPDFKKPTFLLFFSRTSCANCLDKVVDFLTCHAAPALDTYIVSTDINDPAERAAYDARFLRSLPFYALESVRRSPEFDVGLPVLMVVNNDKEILYVKQIMPSDDVQGQYLFWKRINFLYSLLAL